MTIEVRKRDRVGAEVLGFDIGSPSANDGFAIVQAAFAEHGVIFFRDQTISESQHIAFAQRWGQINVNRFFTAHADYPEIALVVKEADQQRNIGGAWHTDHSYDVEPAMGSILVARDLPPGGGATAFASMYAAYGGLPAPLQRRVEGLSAVHSARHVFGSRPNAYEALRESDGRVRNAAAADVLDDVVHPMVITHPLSGKRAIYVNPNFTVRILGLGENASRDLLAEIYGYCCAPEVTEDFHWQPGSVALWDNRATWHLAYNDYPGHRREMHRITIEGVPLRGIN